MENKLSWSAYQKKIFKFIESEKGSAVINAAAGSGKTTTIVEAAMRADKNKNILFLAFNKSVAAHIQEQTGQHKNITCRTLHSYGLSTLMRAKVVTNTTKHDQNKWRTYFSKNIDALSNGKISKYSECGMGYGNIVANTLNLFNMCRINCVDGGNSEIVKSIALKYNIAASKTIIDIVSEVLTVAYIIKPGQPIDFIDMLCLPIKNKNVAKHAQKYDIVFIDEAQDLSMAQQELMKLSIKDGGRFIAVGDPYQAINGFAGALPDSFGRLKKYAGKELHLSVNYRCPKNLIEVVQEIVPTIKAHRGAKNGIIETTKSMVCVKNGDMVIARKVLPLIQTAMRLNEIGKSVAIKGRDIGDSLKHLIAPSLEDDTLSALTNHLSKEKQKLERGVERDGVPLFVLNEFKIKCATIEYIAQRIKRPSEISSFIDKIFSDDIDPTKSIIMSTIHKAKGLEADNVYILASCDLPLTWEGMQDWEKEQEMNLIYVAKTRAKKELYMVDVHEQDIPDMKIDI